MVASLVPEGVARVADIGFDHGDLMLDLLRARPELSCIGVEVKPHLVAGFRKRHARKLAALGSRLELRVGSGIEPLVQGESQLAIVAGMGEKTILKILAAGVGKLAPPALWLLAPVALEAALRPALAGWGLRVLDERLTFEATHYTEVLLVGPGKSEDLDELESRYGRAHFQRRDPLLRPYLEDLGRRHRHALNWQAANGGPKPGDVRGAKLALLAAAQERASREVKPS